MIIASEPAFRKALVFLNRRMRDLRCEARVAQIRITREIIRGTQLRHVVSQCRKKDVECCLLRIAVFGRNVTDQLEITADRNTLKSPTQHNYVLGLNLCFTVNCDQLRIAPQLPLDFENITWRVGRPASIWFVIMEYILEQRIFVYNAHITEKSYKKCRILFPVIDKSINYIYNVMSIFRLLRAVQPVMYRFKQLVLDINLKGTKYHFSEQIKAIERYSVIDSNFKIVSKSIILLESSKLQLSEALNIVDKVSQTVIQNNNSLISEKVK
ncbi:hypothetical protein ANN_09987 [Periplaneta americana]|uniref:Uncharacterized protein n=1 Tax=Periplaneta americana TaxID=6978 RepID=A0ABQ8TQH2_PERAM|nr:hypothetical protein ANN_09987 [Periplaneta americana]